MIRDHKLIVSNCHLHWDPEFCDVKLLQTMIMSNSIQRIKLNHTDPNTGAAPSIVLCGDFNSLPYSGLIYLQGYMSFLFAYALFICCRIFLYSKELYFLLIKIKYCGISVKLLLLEWGFVWFVHYVFTII